MANLAPEATTSNIVDVVEIELVEEIGGDFIPSKNYRFCPVGVPVPIKSDPDTSKFNCPPLQPLVVSERLRLLFVAHNDGFFVARTKEVMASAEEIKDKGSGPSIQELSLIDVPIGKVSVLALSADDSLLAASVDCELHFFPVSALLHKERKPSFSCNLSNSSGIKDIQWAKKPERVCLVLSNEGKLYCGHGQGPFSEVTDNVDAVSWSPEGDLIALARNNVLSFFSPTFKEKFYMSLSFKSLLGDSDANCTVKVDSIKWFREDRIMIGFLQVNDGGDEENYAVQVISSRDEKIIDASHSIVLSFNDVFLAFDPDALPLSNGPHLLLSYLDSHELAFAANRKNSDQHVILFGWSLEHGGSEAFVIEIQNDGWNLRILSQDDGDDNLVIGLALDKVSQHQSTKLILGEKDTEVSPCCLLLCLTIDGKLSIYNFASSAGASVQEETGPFSDEQEDAPRVIESEDVLHATSSCMKEDNRQPISLELKSYAVDSNILDTREYAITKAGDQSLVISVDNKSHEETRAQNLAENFLLNYHTLKGDEQKNTSTMKLKLEGEHQQLFVPGKQGAEFNQSAPVVAQLLGAGLIIGDKRESQMGDTLTLDTRKLSTDTSSQSIIKAEVNKELQMKASSTALQGASVSSPASKNLTTLKVADERSSFSSAAGFGRKLSDTFDRNSLPLSGSFLQNSYYQKETAGSSTSRNSSGQRGATWGGKVDSLSDNRDLQGPLHRPLGWEKSSIKEATSENKLLNKSGNVEGMAQKLDNLLQGIEKEGGFRDASITYQAASVSTLEESMWALSDQCRIWRGIMDEQQRNIQHLLDKTVQVLARKLYMEGIFKQVADNQYWDLWNRQKLSSELELKRQNIIEVNKDLTNQLIELERHFNNIELKKFGENNAMQINRRAFPSRLGKPRHDHSLRSLHTAMNAQLAAAEQLSESLSRQMATLSVESPARKQNVRKELFDAIGLSHDGRSYSSPVKEKAYGTPSNKEVLMTLHSVAPTEDFGRNELSSLKTIEPETARRRRESLDQSWASFDPPKTTLNRIPLQDDGQKVTGSKSSLISEKQSLKPQLQERSAAAHQKLHSTTASSYPSPSKGTYGIRTEDNIKAPTPPFQWATESSSRPAMQIFPLESFSGFSPQSKSELTLVACESSTKETGSRIHENLRHRSAVTATSDSLTLPESKIVLRSETDQLQPESLSISLPTQLQTLTKKSSEFPNTYATGPGPAKISIWDMKHTSALNSSTVQSKSISAADSVFNSSGKVQTSTIVTTKGQTGDTIPSASNTSFSLSKASSTVVVESIPSSFLKQSMPAILDASQGTPVSQSSVSSALGFTSFSSTTAVESSSVSPFPEIHFESSVKPSKAIFGSKVSESPPAPIALANFTMVREETSTTKVSTPKLELPTGMSNLSHGPAVPSTNTSEVAITSEPGNQINVSIPTLDAGLSAIPGKIIAPDISSSRVISSAEITDVGKTSPLDSVVNEDEMEEEAPETSQTTALTLGNLAGFGIGSVPGQTTVKPSPFGVPILDKAAVPASPSLPMTLPSGELFRPASFNFQSPQASQPSQAPGFGAFSGGFGAGSTGQVPVASGFGKPAQLGSGQNALGSVLGAFGQSRQFGAGLSGSSIAPVSSYGNGFVGTSSPGGFGGGFAGVASNSGGFVAAAAGGGGFGSGVGAAGGGFASFSSSGSGFGGGVAVSMGGSFPGSATAGVGFTGGGFGAFSGQQGGGGFSAFGSSSGTGRPPS